MKINRYEFFRNTFYQGLLDTFDILIGNHGILESINGYKPTYRFGALDLLVIPYIALAMFDYGFPIKEISADRVAADETKTGSFRSAIGYIGLALEVVKSIFAFALTLALSPLVLTVHIIKYPFSKYLENKFYSLQGEQHTFSGFDTFKTKKTLGDFAKENDLTLNSLIVNTTENGTTIKAAVPYTGTGSLSDPRSNFKFFVPAQDCEQNEEALCAGRALGFNTY